MNWLLEAPCDILIPAARPDAINARNADRIQCRFILQGADSPSSKPVEYYLYNHKNILSLTDFIVNAGGAIGCAVENKMNMDDKYKKIVQKNGIRTYVEKLITETVTKNTQEIYFRLIENRQSIFRDHASKLGLEEINSKECWL